MEELKSKNGSVTLSYPMLSKTNYTAWSLKMRVYRLAHGIWEAVEPTDEKTVIEDKTDKVALAAIYQAILEDILLSIAEKKTARVTNIRTLGETVVESYVVKKILRAAPSKFLQITSAIEQFGNLDEMSIEETVGSLKAYEERLRGQSENSNGQLLLTEDEWTKRENIEGQLLLTREEWLKRRPRKPRGTSSYQGIHDKSKVKCFNCHNYGHFAAGCRKPKRERDQKPEVNLTQALDDEPTLLLIECKSGRSNTLLLNEGDIIPKLNQDKKKELESNVWYLDNGASTHMTGQRTKFKELDEKITGKVRFGDGSTVEIKGKGTVTFKCKNGEEVTLDGVYYIPTLCNNIISLGQLAENGNKVILNGAFLWVYDK
ncbi:uncharacterized protein LOC141705585 [Apium graveolens]|uniref:uncharacterized protein LOC141705585 n=1 Tax=Apium graveolens TaxID=4045 RepID=UPI003D7B95FE